MGWIGCVRCENFRSDFVVWNFALIAPVQPILHRVWCGNEILPNAPKHYETHQNMSLGSDGVDWADLVQKILTQLFGLNFCINCNSSSCFEPSIVKQRNGPKCPQTLRNKTKHEFRVQWGWIGCIRCEKIGHDFVAWTFEIIAPVQPILHWVYCRNEMVPNAPKHYHEMVQNAPKHYQTQQKMSVGSNGVDQVRSLWKHPTQLHGTNFCINCTSSVHFALSLLP